LNRPFPPVPCPSVEQFITNQPEWSRRLLHTLDNDLSFEEIFQLLTCPTSFPIGACDGSVQSHQDTFGWVLATSNPHRILVRCSGPAYGACIFISCRSLWIAFDHNLSPHTGNILQSPGTAYKNWCDNMAVVNTGNRKMVRTRPEFPNETLPPSLDLIQAICATIKLHPDVSLYGHQDTLTDVRELPFPSQLNIQADLLATTFQRASDHATDRGPLMPGTGCQVLLENQFIPSHHRRTLRTRRGHSQLMKYIQQKHQLSEVAVLRIDWTSHAQAIRYFQTTSNIFMVKFLSK
jgi:hypothetical protein